MSLVVIVLAIGLPLFGLLMRFGGLLLGWGFALLCAPFIIGAAFMPAFRKPRNAAARRAPHSARHRVA